MKRIVSELRKLNWGKRPYAFLVLCATAATVLPAQTVTPLFSFDGTDGNAPASGLVQATNGDLYGTTCGTCDAMSYDGTVFKMTPAGKLTTLYSFCSQTGCTDGEYPYAGLVQAANGALYGTTMRGGASASGTVFRITLAGKLTTLYSFSGSDGSDPWATLVQATNGDLYGTTVAGGTNGFGTAFRITPSGKLTTLYSFCTQSGCTDGEYPYAGLVQATNGALYGTTYEGGTNGFGTVFRITPSGKLTTLYSFSGPDGSYPSAALVQATNGALYGTTFYGGASGSGTIFRITPSGKLTTLYCFSGPDGSYPSAALVQGTDGNLYGTTHDGGAGSNGTLFKMSLSGELTTLHSFCLLDCADGGWPTAALVQDTNGTFYGANQYGGTSGYGTVFSASVGLGPFVVTRPTSGEVGAGVKILGTDLTGATGVTFNGTAAVFTVVSAVEITATVPAGATTGTVQVVTPSGTLSSNVSFRVP